MLVSTSSSRFVQKQSTKTRACRRIKFVSRPFPHPLTEKCSHAPRPHSPLRAQDTMSRKRALQWRRPPFLPVLILLLLACSLVDASLVARPTEATDATTRRLDERSNVLHSLFHTHFVLLSSTPDALDGAVGVFIAYSMVLTSAEWIRDLSSLKWAVTKDETVHIRKVRPATNDSTANNSYSGSWNSRQVRMASPLYFSLVDPYQKT